MSYIFNYPLRINGDKYPEVVAALEKAKERDGIAIYIRHAIEQDLINKALMSPDVLTRNQTVKHEPEQVNITPQNKPEIKKASDESDDFFQGLA